MSTRTPDEATVVAFNERINARDLEGLIGLMTDEHCFVDTDGNAVVGRDACADAWRGFFTAFPDYRNRFATVRTVAPGVVEVEGSSECAVPELCGPANWRVVVVDGCVHEWHVSVPEP